MAATNAVDDSPPSKAVVCEVVAEELMALCAIFPELLIDAADRQTACLDLPVVPNAPIQISFADEAVLTAPNAQIAHAAMETHHLANLPPLHIRFSLPKGYPSAEPPLVELSTKDPAWLPSDKIDHLQRQAEQLWEDLGRNEVLFTYIDLLQEASFDAFGISSLDVSQGDKIALLDFDVRAKQAKFNTETFNCGICLDPKKGSACHRMMDCGHVFCVQCLQDFYNNAIKTGDLATVRCLAPNCAKERGAYLPSDNRKPEKPRTYISPSELLQIPLSPKLVKRYVDLKHKSDLETDRSTVYCPRKWCQGAARSKKHRKPQGLEIVEGDEEEEERHDNRMRICEDCSFAFCSQCHRSWHGDYYACVPESPGDKMLTEEEKASLEYLEKHSTCCPTCSARAQKTHGCNHMLCFKCNTHFCYLCGMWLAPENPYRHYNFVGQYCYMRLWELEDGDGHGAGGHGAAGNNIAPVLAVDRPPGARDHAEGNGAAPAHRPPPPGRDRRPAAPMAGPVLAHHVREGPLVIRIEGLARPAAEQDVAGPGRPPPAMHDPHAANAHIDPVLVPFDDPDLWLGPRNDHGVPPGFGE